MDFKTASWLVFNLKISYISTNTFALFQPLPHPVLDFMLHDHFFHTYIIYPPEFSSWPVICIHLGFITEEKEEQISPNPVDRINEIIDTKQYEESMNLDLLFKTITTTEGFTDP